MCNAWNHPADCTCGWGGEGHLGQSPGFANFAGLHVGWYHDGQGLCWIHSDDVCRPTACPRCKRDVYFVRHNGGSVWFDELGWPWSIHPCFADGRAPRAVGPSSFSVHESTNTTARVSDALVDLVDSTANARIGVVKRVVAMGTSLRIAVVATGDGEDREVAVEQRLAPTKLVGAIAVYTPGDWLVAFLCDDRAIRGWWFDEPPGDWRDFNPVHIFSEGEITYHSKIGVGVVVSNARPDHEADQKVQVVLITGETKTFSAATAGLQWLERTKEYAPWVPIARRVLANNVTPAAAPSSPTPTPRQRCPHCGWHVRKLTKHLRTHHPDSVT